MKAKKARTRFLFGRRAAIAGGAVAALAATVAIVRSRGYDSVSDLPDERRAKLLALAPWQFVVVRHLARRICAPDEIGGVVDADATDVAGFVDAYVAKMSPPKLRRDLMRFLGYIEQLAPAALGLTSRFTRLAPTDQDRVLVSLEASSIDLLRGGFEGVKALLFMGYYRDPRTWTVLGYDGPLLHREESLQK